jgi:hypothetical protein
VKDVEGINWKRLPLFFALVLFVPSPKPGMTALSLPLSYSIFYLCSSEGLLFKLTGEREESGAKLDDNKKHVGLF